MPIRNRQSILRVGNAVPEAADELQPFLYAQLIGVKVQSGCDSRQPLYRDRTTIYDIHRQAEAVQQEHSDDGRSFSLECGYEAQPTIPFDHDFIYWEYGPAALCQCRLP